MEYRCAHCGAELGPVPQEPEPKCANHPDGVVETFANADPIAE